MATTTSVAKDKRVGRKVLLSRVFISIPSTALEGLGVVLIQLLFFHRTS